MGGRVLFALSIAAFPEDFPQAGHGGGVRGGGGEGPRGGRRAGGRPHDPGPGAQVRAGGDRRGAPGPAAPQGRRAAGRRADPDQAAGDRAAGQRAAIGPDVRCATWRRPSTQMRALNRAASEVLVRHGIRGATDVTGFGLLGHGLEMARASGARLVFEAAALPALDGALDLARAGVETGGAEHNRRFTAPSLVVGRGCRAGAGGARARPADLRGPAGGDPGGRCRDGHGRRSQEPASRRGESGSWRRASPASSSASRQAARRRPVDAGVDQRSGHPTGLRDPRTGRNRPPRVDAVATPAPATASHMPSGHPRPTTSVARRVDAATSTRGRRDALPPAVDRCGPTGAPRQLPSNVPSIHSGSSSSIERSSR